MNHRYNIVDESDSCDSSVGKNVDSRRFSLKDELQSSPRLFKPFKNARDGTHTLLLPSVPFLLALAAPILAAFSIASSFLCIGAVAVAGMAAFCNQNVIREGALNSAVHSAKFAFYAAILTPLALACAAVLPPLFALYAITRLAVTGYELAKRPFASPNEPSINPAKEKEERIPLKPLS